MSKTLSMIDPPEIKELLGGDKARVTKRKQMINDFLKWRKAIPKSFSEQDPAMENIIKNQENYCRGMKGFCGLISGAFYFMFLRGVYTFRCYELINMRTIPSPFRLLAAGAVGYYTYSKLYTSHIYNRDLYSLAIKYHNEIYKENSQ